jgi:hypothetical protein
MANQQLPKYGFIPWARKGLGNMIEDQDAINNSSTNGRPRIKITTEITDGGSTVISNQIKKEVNLVGPGDIIGFDENCIIKNEPAVGRLNNFERNYLPYIEFYEEDFPWRFSPGKSVNHKLTPWLTLIVLKNDGSEYKRNKEIVGYFPSIEILDESILPSPNELWAWAHVQFTGDLLPSEVHSGAISHGHRAKAKLTDALSENSDVAFSRILCPRLLEPNTAYTGFLIPTYEAGRLAGLGDFEGIDAINSQRSSYQSGAPKGGLYPELFPVYFQWDFATGEKGDFEELVRLLEPQRPDAKVGKRPMYIGKPGYGVKYQEDSKATKVLDLEGALQVPKTSRLNFPWPDSNEYRRRLTQFINLSDDLVESTFLDPNHYIQSVFNQNNAVEDDPIITADLYGSYHALQRRLSPFGTTWVSELNLDPRNRAIAGLGVEYIKQNQENLVDKAWEQLGEVMEANKKIEWGQLATTASSKGYKKNIETLSTENQIAMMGGVLSRVKLGSDQNLSALGKLDASILPNATVSSAYKKLARPNGPLMKRIAIKESTIIRQSLADKVNGLRLTSLKTASSQLAVINNNTLDRSLNAIQTQNVRVKSHNVPLEVGKDIKTQLNIAGSLKFTQAYSSFNNYFKPDNWKVEVERDTLDLGALNTEVKKVIQPKVSIPLAVMSPISFAFAGFDLIKNELIPIMAHPVYQEPVYEHVLSLGKEFFLPNLHLIPDNSITLMETNQRFIESFMVGLNHEMGKELLWRGYPTDQRGSYFRQFWNVADIPLPDGMTEAEFAELNNDIAQIHQWEKSNNLGENDFISGQDSQS